MTDPLPAVAEKLANELRRLPCRVSHGPKDLSKCPRCCALSEYEALISIVQLPGVPARVKT